MILVLGGTTEGRVAAATIEEAGQTFYYSTKGNEQEIALHNGVKLEGGMDKEEMTAFCQEHGIRLMVDAAHPFAEMLHSTVADVSQSLDIPVIRLERIYPDRDEYPFIIWCNGYEDAIEKITHDGVKSLLALTGVQSIAKLKPLWKDGTVDCRFRILDRDSSRRIATSQGFPLDKVCYYSCNDIPQLFTLHSSLFTSKAVLLKESGNSGGFPIKVETAQQLGMKVYALRRPQMPDSFITVNGEHGLRRMIEKLLPDYFHLHSGLTTGTCATAATVSAIYSSFGFQKTEVPVILPNGETINVECDKGTVVKDAGDDPDVTNGMKVCSQVDFAPSADYEILIKGGEGVGRVTLPGLGLEVGGPAINEMPQKMIRLNALNALKLMKAPTCTCTVTISVPGGEEIAKRTFNPRLGVTGGISIIGTSGIVKPFSSEAFILSIKKSLEVARSSGTNIVVINSGAKSERFLRPMFPNIPQQAFVHYGNFIGETIKLCDTLNIINVVLGLMIGKAVKLAEGYLDTHSKQSAMNKDFIASIAAQAGCQDETLTAIKNMTMARELWDIIPQSTLPEFSRLIKQHCYHHCSPLLPNGKLSIVLLNDEGSPV